MRTDGTNNRRCIAMATARSERTDRDKLPLTLKVQDVADVLGVSRATVDKIINSEGFPVIRVGKRLITPRDAFFRWLDGAEGTRVV
jgi:excisionase family DNA binding protein